MKAMAALLKGFTVLSLLFLVEPCRGRFNPRSLANSSLSGDDWWPAGATWYGSPDGYGTDGGACGYEKALGSAPYWSLIAAGGPSLFYSGQGCGACYQVKCTGNAACSGNPVTVVITDECPGGPCASEPVHFDLSGTAFGAMAHSGQADQLRNAGVLQIQFRRVQCNYPGSSIFFHVDAGSNPNYFAVVMLYVNGDGNLKSVELLQSKAGATWLSMDHMAGVGTWKLNYWATPPLQPPFSLRLTSSSGKMLTATNVIPADWKPGMYYKSQVNF